MKIRSAWGKILEEDLYPDLTEFSEIAGISRQTLRNYPEWHQKLKNRFKEKGIDKRKERTLRKIEAAWNQVLEEDLYPTIPEFAKMVGCLQDSIRVTYPEWATKIRERHEEVSSGSKIKNTWKKVLEEDLYPTVRQFGIMAGVKDSYIHKRYPEWMKKITERYKRGDLRDTPTKLKDAWNKVIQEDLYPTVPEFAKIAGINGGSIYKRYREWVVKIQERYEKNVISTPQKIEMTWNDIVEKGLYPNVAEFAEMVGINKATLYDIYHDWTLKISERYQNKQDKTFMRKNTASSKLFVLKNGDWQLLYIRAEKEKKVSISWKHIPDEWLVFWQDVAKSLFDKDKIMEMASIIRTAKRFHAWLALPVIDLETGEILGSKRSIKNFDELTESDFGQFEEVLKIVPLAELPIVGTESQRSSILSDLAEGLQEAIRELERPEVTIETVERIREVKNGAYKNMYRKAYERNAKKALSIIDLEDILEALAREYIACEEIGNALQRTLYTKPTDMPDMLAVIYIRLGLKHGLRPEEIFTMKIDDIKEDKENGHHTIHCKGVGNKPERYVPIDQGTLDAIKFYLQWSEPARKELGTKLFAVCYIQVRSGVFEAKAATSSNLRHALRYFKKRHGLKSDLQINGKNLRRTFGSIVAMTTDNREVVRQALGHTHVSTTERHYTAINRINLSHEVAKALRVYALEIAFSYRNIVYDLNEERPDVQKALEDSPERDLNAGVCNVPKKTESLADSCVRAPSCLECDFLIVEARKLPFYYTEKEKYMKKYEEAKSDRVKQSRLRRVQQLEAYIFRIEEAINKKKELDLQQDSKGSKDKLPRRRTAYKKKAR